MSLNPTLNQSKTSAKSKAKDKYYGACVTYCVLDLVIDPHDFHYPQTRSPHSRDTNISDINYTILQKRGTDDKLNPVTNNGAQLFYISLVLLKL